MDYNSTFIGLIVAGIVLVAIGFGLVLTQSPFRPAAAVMTTDHAPRNAVVRTVEDDQTPRREPITRGLGPPRN